MVDKAIIDIARKYISLIPLNFGLKEAYIFGSYAKGRNVKNSDIDIALVLSNIGDFFETQLQLMRLRRNIDLRIEPHPIAEDDYNDLNPLAGEIRKYGIKIIP